jgi:hypothetical protein
MTIAHWTIAAWCSGSRSWSRTVRRHWMTIKLVGIVGSPRADPNRALRRFAEHAVDLPRNPDSLFVDNYQDALFSPLVMIRRQDRQARQRPVQRIPHQRGPEAGNRRSNVAMKSRACPPYFVIGSKSAPTPTPHPLFGKVACGLSEDQRAISGRRGRSSCRLGVRRGPPLTRRPGS